MELDDREQKIWEWVKHIHRDHKRKYTGEPYHVHLWAVAELCNAYLHRSTHCVPIAFLHDSVEDKKATMSEVWVALLEAGYVSEDRRIIYKGVEALTDIYTHESHPNHNREQRKRMESERLGEVDPLYQSIKYADIIDNSLDIAKHDPDFAVTYIKEIRRNLNEMRKGNIDLFIGACSSVVDAERTLAQHHLAHARGHQGNAPTNL